MKSEIWSDRQRPKTLNHARKMYFGRSLLDFKLASHLWPVIAKIRGIFIFLDVKILTVVLPDTIISESTGM